MAAPDVPDDLPVLRFADTAAFEAWMEAEHGSARGLWLMIAKKGTGVASVTAAEALDVVLCCGWIDGQRRALDETHFLQRYTPRRRRSPWSKINRDKVEALIAAGRMRPAGHAEIERAKADGRWDAAYAGQRVAVVPDDLQRALDADAPAAAFFATLDSRNRYAILYRVNEAKRSETRVRRIATFVAMCREGRKVHP
ncbi:MAG TPA: YdeI/OmpD-associated family protein [Baekduia sp.]|uniref:YdeI/OmpD-associated family protein n=1 Tax=Baekduia sp. TaxID=2600305 RepID=UPI002B5544E8|nr:YdeI/OmpD-associated family protein [Baekduia sp.]HMJ32945.1 YdeI/OmpD-associated family protein [Baekduia sp.]